MKIFCNDCKEECYFEIINTGAGWNSYRGSPGYDEHLEIVSICCGADCIDENGQYVDAKQAQKQKDVNMAELRGD